MSGMSRGTALLPVVLLLACHDSPRRNPLDPELTPAVELTVTADDSLGTATLSWTPYAGVAPFGQYWVLRNQTERTRVDTLARIDSLGQTTYIDRTLQPDTGYEYRVAVVGAAGLEVPSAIRAVQGYTVAGVQLLAAEGDSLEGAIRLRWQRFSGPGFQAYQIQRREIGHDQADLLAEVPAQGDTAFVDAGVRHGVTYLYRVDVAAAGQLLVSNLREGRLALPPIPLLEVATQSTTATARVTWARYRGPRYSGYRLERRSAAGESVTVTETFSPTDTTFLDTGLLGNTEYLYRVTVLTTTGEEVSGPEAGGRFHAKVAEWPMPITEVGKVRLYWESGRLQALTAENDRIHLTEYSADGTVLTEIPLRAPLGASLNAAVSVARSATGDRLLTVSLQDRRLCVLQFGQDNEPVWRQQLTFTGDGLRLPEAQAGPGQVEWSLVDAQLQSSTSAGVWSSLSGLQLAVDDAPLMAGDDFAREANWSRSYGQIEFGSSELTQHADHLLLGGSGGAKVQRDVVGRAWRSWNLEAVFAVVKLHSGLARITLRVCPDLTQSDQAAIVNMSYGSRILTTGLDVRIGSTAPMSPPFWPETGMPYRLRLAGDVTSTSGAIDAPVAWQDSLVTSSAYGSIAVIGEYTVLFVGSQPMLLDADGSAAELPGLPGPASEVRTWSRPGTKSSTRMAICLPEQHTVLVANPISSTTGGFRWPFESRLVTSLGSGVGESPGELVYPLSVAPGSGDRLYVLDAGNGRIAVFRTGGEYLTHWGTPGSGPGQFAFGEGKLSTDLRGSIAVDDEGFIYVADPGNQRIQKFAP